MRCSIVGDYFLPRIEPHHSVVLVCTQVFVSLCTLADKGQAVSEDNLHVLYDEQSKSREVTSEDVNTAASDQQPPTDTGG